MVFRILFLLFMYSSTSFAVFDSMIFIERFIEEKKEYFQIMKQYSDMKQLQKETDLKLSKINEWSKTISEHTGIKLGSSQEVVEFFTNETFAKRKALDGLFSKDFFKNNPEYSSAIKKLVHNQELSLSDYAALGDAAFYNTNPEKNEEFIITRRLQRRGYSKNQIESVLNKRKELMAIQEQMKNSITQSQALSVKLNSYKDLRENLDCTSFETNQQKNECNSNGLLMDNNIANTSSSIIENNNNLEILKNKQSRLLNYLKNLDLAVVFNESKIKESKIDQEYEYRLFKSNADSAEEKLEDFINFSKLKIGGQ